MANKSTQLQTKKIGSVTSLVSKQSNDSLGSVGAGLTLEQQVNNEEAGANTKLVRLLQILDTEKISLNPCYDVVVLLVTCREHRKIATRKLLATSKLYWLPFLSTGNRKMHTEALETAIKAILQRQDSGCLVTRNLAEVPHSVQLIDSASLQNECGIWFERRTFWVQVPNCVKELCQNDVYTKVEWRSIDSILSADDCCWGRDMLRLIESVKPHLERESTVEIPFNLEEYEYEDNFPLGTSNGSVAVNNSFITLFKSAKLSPKTLQEFYSDFRKQTFPSLDMNLPSFKHYLLKHGYTAEKCSFGSEYSDKETVFKLLHKSGHNRPGMGQVDKEFGFQNLCYVVIAMDPNCSDRYARSWLLFNMFSKNAAELSSTSTLNSVLGRDVSLKKNEKLKFEQFETIYRENKMLHKMLRFPKSVFELLNQPENLSKVERSKSKSQYHNHGSGTCFQCRANNYALSHHIYMINQAGNIDHQKSTASHIDRIFPENDYDRYSLEIAHKPNSLPNLLRKYLAQKTEMSEYHLMIIQLCRQLAIFLDNRPKMVKIRAPVLVVPELHGMFDYYLALEKRFMPLHPALENSVIFLGNYIGAKDLSNPKVVDLVVYLFATKLLDINRVILLRGAQECGRVIPKLMIECKARFGKNSEQVIDALMSVFELLPYVALVNETVCCIPSGIPQEAISTTLYQLFESIQSSSQATVRETLFQFAKSKPLDEGESPKINRRSSSVMSSISSVSSNQSRQAKRSRNRNKTRISRKSQSKKSRNCKQSDNGRSKLRTNSMSKLASRKRSSACFDEDMFRIFMRINQLNVVIRNGNATSGFRVMINKKLITLGANAHRGSIVAGIVLMNGRQSIKLFTFDYNKPSEGLTRHDSYIEL